MARLIGNVDATGSLTTPNVTIDTSNTLLYLPLDADTNDDSPEAQSITNSGVTISSTQAKFGSYSGYFDGSSFLQVAYDASLGGTSWMHGDYTLEAWLYPTDASSEKTIFSRWDADTSNRQFVLKMNTNRTLTWEMRNVGDYTTSNTITLNTWSHVAVSESSGVVRCFINGVQGFQQTVGNANSVDRYIDIGRREPGGATRYFVGYMDDVRFLSSGIYTAAFTPVTSSYGAGVETTTNDTRTFSSIWNLNSAVVAENFKAGNWPTVPIPIAWDTTNVGSSVVISNSNLTATISSSNSGWNETTAISVGGHASGKKYFEATVSGTTGSGYFRLGVVQNKGSATLTEIQTIYAENWDSNAPAYANKSENRSLYNGGEVFDGSDEPADGDVFMWALDIGNARAYFGLNGSFDLSFDPVNGTGGYNISGLPGYNTTDPWHIFFQNLVSTSAPTLRTASEAQYLPSGYTYWGT